MKCNEDANSQEPDQGLQNPTPRTQFFVGIKLILPTYIPSNRNQLKGSHWSAEFHEKKRAALALRLSLQSIQDGHAIGMGITSSLSKTYLQNLESYLETHGISLKGVCVQDVFRRKSRSARKSTL